LVFQNELKQLFTDCGRLVGEVSTLRSASAEIGTLSGEVSGLKNQTCWGVFVTQFVEQLSTKFDELRKGVSALKTQLAAFPSIPNAPPSAASGCPFSGEAASLVRSVV
jgi:hypothetical protein